MIIYENLNEPDFSDKNLSDGVIVFRNITTTITEKSFQLSKPLLQNHNLSKILNNFCRNV